MSKQHDLMLNFLANPQSSIEDFQKAGLSAQNTSLEDENTYLNSEKIINNPIFLNESGEFDKTKFHLIYLLVARGMNILNTEPLDFKPIFSKYNIWAPESQRENSPQFELTKVDNPDRITKSMIVLGQNGLREFTPQEIAQSQKVWNTKENKWMESPEDMFSFKKLFNDFGGFFSDNFGSTKVMAQYEEDIDINGNKRGDLNFDENNIEHYKGEYKLNDNGTYYYRTLDDNENVYGKQTLHYSDILTREGSALNAIDFLDSDDIQKSPFGSFVKNASLIGALFIPYVGPWVTGATIFQQAAGLGATLGKIALGSDNSTMNWIEGLVESTNPLNTKSEWSLIDYGNIGRNPTWTVENLLGMVGNVVAQLRQQRFLFLYSPYLFKGKWGMNEKNKELLKEEYLKELNALTKDKIKITGDTPLDLMKYNAAKTKLFAENSRKAADMVENYMKSWYKYGEELSKAYMTMLTVNDIYGEAKEAGASDFDSAVITSGYAAMEYALLSTDIGKWILPELRAHRLENKAIRNALTKPMIDNFKKLAANAKNSEAAKRTYLLKLIDFGKDNAKKIFNGEFNVGLGKNAAFEGGSGLLKTGASSLFAGAMAEAVEETSEELLADFSRVLFNGLQNLQGKDTRLNPFENVFDRYTMSFLGGFLGGGISSATFDYLGIKPMLNMDYNKAVQLIVHKAHNNDLDGLYKVLNETVGNKNLSATKYDIDEDGNRIYKQGDENDNQDKAIKEMALKQIDLIKNTLNAHGGKTDDEILDIQTVKDLRYAALRDSTTAGLFLQKYNELLTEIYKKTEELRSLNTPQTKAEHNEGSKKDEKNPELDAQRKKITDEIDELDKKLDEFHSGAKAPLFMATALIETTPFIASALMPATFKTFVEFKSGKSFDKATEAELKDYENKYREYLSTLKKDDLLLATISFLNTARLAKQNLDQIIDVIEQQENDPIIRELLLDASAGFSALDFLEKSSESWQEMLQSWIQENQSLGNDLLTKASLINNTYNAEVNNRREIINATKISLQAVEEEFQKELEDLNNLGSLADDIRETSIKEAENRRDLKIEEISKDALSLGIDINKDLDSLLQDLDQQSKEKYFKLFQDLFFDVKVKKAQDLADKIISSKFINGAIKNLVISKLQSVSEAINKSKKQAEELFFQKISGDLLSGDVDFFKSIVIPEALQNNDLGAAFDETLFYDEDGTIVKEYKKEYESILEYDKQKLELDTKIEQIRNLDYTPIISTLDSFSLGLGKGKISSLLNSLERSLFTTGNNISLFTIGKSMYSQLAEAERVMNLFIATLEGMRVDNIDPFALELEKGEFVDKSKLWGITRVINEVHKMSSKRENDNWEDLPEIEGVKADMLIEDAKRLKQQLRMYRTLYGINQGQRLNALQRVSTKTTYLIYDKIRRLLTNPNLPDKEKLESVIESLSTLKEATQDEDKTKWNLSLSKELRKQIEKERILMEDAIFDYFLDKLDDVDKLKKIFNLENFLLLDRTVTLLNEDSDDIDGTSFVGYLAAKACLKSSSFQSSLKEILKTGKRAPLLALEIAATFGLANVLNGNGISNIIKAYTDSILELSDDKLKKYLSQKDKNNNLIYSDNMIKIFLTKEGRKLFINENILPQYTNITFIDGIPGSGKTEGVDFFIMLYLLLNHKDIANQAWVSHGGNISKKFAENIGISEQNAFDKDELLNNIFEKPEKEDVRENGVITYDPDNYDFDENGKIIPKYRIKNSWTKDNVPSVIFIDEALLFTQLELLALDEFARKFGIALVLSGDLNQSLLKGKIKLKESIKSSINKELKEKGEDIQVDDNIDIDFSRNQALHTPKLGSSMRSENNQKDINLANTQAIVESQQGILLLHYYEDENVLAGDKRIDGIDFKEITDHIDKIIPLLSVKDGEKIHFAVTNLKDSIVIQLKNIEKYNRIIEFHEGVALGQEGSYWIIKMDAVHGNSFLQDFYTGQTRSKKFSLLISPESVLLGKVTIQNIKDPETHPVEYNPDAVKRFANELVEILNEILPKDITPIDIKPRTIIEKSNPIDSTPIEDTPVESINNLEKVLEEVLPFEFTVEPELESESESTTETELLSESSENNIEEEIPVEDISDILERTQSEKEVQELINENNGVNVTERENPSISSEFSLEKFLFRLFSNATFERGTDKIFTEDGVEIFEKSDIEGRIDGVNGLFDERLKNPYILEIRRTKRVSDADNVLGMISRLIRSSSTKSDLETKLKAYLGLDEIPYIRFGIKISEFNTDGFLDSSKPFNKLEKKSSEKSPYARAQVSREESQSNFVNNRFLVAIIGTKNSDIIEVPILGFNNPATIIRRNLDLNHPLRQDFESVLEETRDYVKTFLFINSKYNGKEYEGLNILIRQYLNTNRQIRFIDDETWVPQKGLKSLGVLLNKKRGHDIYENENYIQDESYIKLDELRKDPNLQHITKPMLHQTGILDFPDGTHIKFANRKHPFVLFTDQVYGHRGNLLDNDLALINEFKYQQLVNYKGPKTILLVYILPPKFTIENYVDSLVDVMINKKGFSLGNQRTAYKILEGMVRADVNETRKLFEDTMGENGIRLFNEKVLPLIKTLSELSISDLIKFLVENEDTWVFGNVGIPKNMPIYKQLLNIIKLLVYPQSVSIDISSTDNIPSVNVYLNNRNVNKTKGKLYLERIQNLLDKSGTILYYQVKTVKTDRGNFVSIQTNERGHILDNYIGEQDFEINGSIASSNFETTEEFNEILNDLWKHRSSKDRTTTNRDGSFTVYSVDDIAYAMKKDSSFKNSTSRVTSRPNSVSPIIMSKIENYPELKDKLRFSPTKFNDNSDLLIIDLVEQIRHIDGYYAFKNGNSIIIAKNDLLVGEKTISEYEENTSGLKEFKFTINGTLYNAVLYGNKLLLSEIILNTENYEFDYDNAYDTEIINESYVNSNKEKFIKLLEKLNNSNSTSQDLKNIISKLLVTKNSKDISEFFETYVLDIIDLQNSNFFKEQYIEDILKFDKINNNELEETNSCSIIIINFN